MPRAFDDDDTVNEGDESRTIRSLLVYGDRDLSYSVGIAPDLARMGIRLMATVLEEEEIHNRGDFMVLFCLFVCVC